VEDIGDLYGSEGDRLWRAVAAFTRDDEIASDAVAEAFAQCLRRGASIRSPKAWIWKAAFRIAAGALQERTAGLMLPAEAPYEMSTTDLDVLAAVSKLPPRQRASVILRYYADYDMRMIADVLGCGTTTARVHLSRARRTLSKLLDPIDD